MTATESTLETDPSNHPRTRTASAEAGREITYTEYGPTDGHPVVFLHGTPGSRRLGELFSPAVQQFDVRLLAPDRPGYGHSSPWPERSVRDTADVVDTVLDDADVETAGLVAFSGGAPYALATAVTSPERLDRVDVVAGASPADVNEDVPAMQRLLSGMATKTPAVLRGVFRAQAWMASRLDPSFVLAQYTTDADPQSVPEEAATVVKADFVEAFSRHRSGAVTEFRHATTDWDVAFDEIETDVCFWHGEHDTNVPIDGTRRLQARIPTAELRVFDDADHLGTLLRSLPDVVAEHR